MENYGAAPNGIITCDVPGCTSPRDHRRKKCKHHQNQIDRGQLPDIISHPMGRPQLKNFTDHNPQSQKQAVKKLINTLAHSIIDLGKSPEGIQAVTEQLSMAPLISTLTHHSSALAKVGSNTLDFVENNSPSQYTASLLQIALKGVSNADAHNLVSFSPPTITHAHNLCDNILSMDRFKHGITRQRASAEDIADIAHFWADHTEPAAPAQRGSTIQKVRGDDSSRVAKQMQRLSDADMYRVYKLEWENTVHSDKERNYPFSKAYLIAHKYVVSIMHPHEYF